MKKEIPWDLIISRLRQEITAEDDRLLMEWLSDSKNKEVFDELMTVWQKVRNRTSGYTPDKNHYWNELSARMKAKETLVNEKVGKRDAGTSRKFFMTFLRYASVVCLAVVLSYIMIETRRPEPAEQVYSTLGGKSRVTLPDGTQVWLHSTTHLAYNTDFKEEDRLVTVSGEAYFDVTHDKEKPFIVQTDGMRIVVHGTKFNVESFPESENTFVSLREGSVALETAKESCFLSPGEMATFNKHNNELRIEKSDVDFTSSWANDKMVFIKKPVGDVCRFLSKWYHVTIHLAPGLENKYTYTFTLRNEPLEEILRLMSFIHPVDYHFDEENILTISPKSVTEKADN